MARCNVLIIGAGPTGLVLALWLTKLGIAVRIIDKAAEPGTTSRALAVQARTLELYRQVGLADAVIERGHKVPAVNLWVRGKPAARLPFERIGAELTPYAFLEIFPQDEHEHLLIERLGELGVTVERRTELVGLTDHGDGVTAQLRGPGGQDEAAEAAYVAGCDGARSTVRDSLGTGFPGGTYEQVFYVADVDAAGPAIDGKLHVDLDEADFLAVFPLAGRGRVRLIGTVRGERAERAETLTFDDVSARAMTSLKVMVRQVNWFSTYRIHHRVAAHFRKGHAFLVGDAAHIHSPAGGQGMNTGIGDAINLAWKLAWVLTGRAPESLLDSYEAERIGFARRLVATTDRAFKLVTADGRFAAVVRTHLVPLLAPRIVALGPVRTFMFRAISQIGLTYRGLPLNAGQAGEVHGGDRLPWTRGSNGDNFAWLTELTWQVHIYGAASPVQTGWCAARGVPLYVFPWRPEHAIAGLAENAAYLLRPDSYVGLADASATPAAIEAYLAARGIRLDVEAPPAEARMRAS